MHERRRAARGRRRWSAPLRAAGEEALLLLAAPLALSFLVPLALLDAWLWAGQHVCFPAYRIAKVPRARRGLRAAGFGYLMTALFAGGVALLSAWAPPRPSAHPSRTPRLPASVALHAAGLDAPFAVAFHPPGPRPRWVYVACAGRVVRFALR